MLLISEHFQFYSKSKNHFDFLQKIDNKLFSSIITDLAESIYFKSNRDKKCIQISVGENKARIENSYYIGLDWIHAWNLPVQIESKMNSSVNHLDTVTMLLEALKEPENFEHLDDLMDIKFQEEWIEVKGDKSIQLTPFLLVQFLMVVRSIVRKGLKKDYYKITENLNGRVKGKILVNHQIRQNIVRNKLANVVCSYQEFGVNTSINRFLKYVLHFIQAKLEYIQSKELKDNLLELLRYNTGGFQRVEEERFLAFRNKESNPFYKEYNVAIELGNQILKLMDHNLSKAANKQNFYPPHWIDMSKLFELYVFKKLRDKFPASGAVKYHAKVNRQELDFIISSGEFKAVVDAKYKPRYASGNPSMDDARQLSGYARLNRVYKELDITNNELIPVYFVYPKDLQTDKGADHTKGEDEEVFELMDEVSTENLIGQSLFSAEEKVRKSTSYRKMYMQEIAMVHSTKYV